MAHCYACLSEISDWASRCPYCTAEVGFAGACPSHHLTERQMTVRVVLTWIVVWIVAGWLLGQTTTPWLQRVGEFMLWPLTALGNLLL